MYKLPERNKVLPARRRAAAGAAGAGARRDAARRGRVPGRGAPGRAHPARGQPPPAVADRVADDTVLKREDTMATKIPDITEAAGYRLAARRSDGRLDTNSRREYIGGRAGWAKMLMDFYGATGED